ncbi:hypothetical protein T09_5833 [Trichinella sp. T9]|nr:hypothetical protein T09_8956 [Trichinella sp. T9]KRX35022.1 hypothetical protein T09_5833 [Trichinella sp. T9]
MSTFQMWHHSVDSVPRHLSGLQLVCCHSCNSN